MGVTAESDVLHRHVLIGYAVAVEMESGVVQLIVEHVCIALATHGRSSAVTVWAAKCLASSSSNGESNNSVAGVPHFDFPLIIHVLVFFAAALGDSKLAGRCCDLLTEVLLAFPNDPLVWTWGLYALQQLLIRNCEFHQQDCGLVGTPREF